MSSEYVYKLEDYLNKKNSLRNLAKKFAEDAGIEFNDEDDNTKNNWKKVISYPKFNDVLYELAEQLVKRGHLPQVTSNDNELLSQFFTNTDEEQEIKQKFKKEFEKLKSFESDKKELNSTTRIGMGILEHFMPNFYDIKDSNGISFNDKWSDVNNLVKILEWNVKSHSTPYISELKRGIYLCCGGAKNTMYRPTITKMIVQKYAKNKRVLDPCVGWGGRMIGTVAAGCDYIGFEPNTETFNNLKKMVECLGIGDKVILYNDIAENIHKYDIDDVSLILTSPPYYNLEIYCDEETQSYKNNQTYDEWLNDFLKNIIKQCISKGTYDVVSVWNVHNFKKYKLIDDVENIHTSIGLKNIDQYSVVSSKRQTSQYKTIKLMGHDTKIKLKGKLSKNHDYSICYSQYKNVKLFGHDTKIKLT
jgi:16S rRNA G966 N2-methylase RsmD